MKKFYNLGALIQIAIEASTFVSSKFSDYLLFTVIFY